MLAVSRVSVVGTVIAHDLLSTKPVTIHVSYDRRNVLISATSPGSCEDDLLLATLWHHFQLRKIVLLNDLRAVRCSALRP